MRVWLSGVLGFLSIFLVLSLLHYPVLRLPYFWDEAGYYIPAALDFYGSGLLIPQRTLPTGHTPLVMMYLGWAWRVFGFSPLVTRCAMLLVAAGSVGALYLLGRRVARREAAAWSALLLAISPLFFAQSSLAHLDLPAALFTTLAILALLERSILGFALAASLSVLSKETAVILLPVAWAFAWHRRRELSKKHWLGLAAPLLPTLAWAAYYHHSTGYWTGNPEYLEYNLYSTLNPARIGWSLLRRLYEIFLAGFNWLLVAGAALGIGWRRRSGLNGVRDQLEEKGAVRRDFFFLAALLTAGYALMLSLVGGAVLPRYLLPIFPPFYLALVVFAERLPKAMARALHVAMTACLVGAWFINPPYPFPFEDNLSYADFVRLHQQAGQYLEAQPAGTRILTAWPGSDELTHPFLGYARKPLCVVPLQGFTARNFGPVRAESFDLLYLFSRQWEPANNWLTWLPALQQSQQRYFDYAPQIPDEFLAARYHLKLVWQIARRGQWVKIYSKQRSQGIRQSARAAF